MCVRNCFSSAGSRDRSSAGSSRIRTGRRRRTRRRSPRPVPAGLQREPREVQPGRPALGPGGQLGEFARIESRLPTSSKQDAASCSSSRRSSTPISCTCPCARHRASGSWGSSLLAIAIAEPAGTYSNSAATVSRHDGLETRCRSSSTITVEPSPAVSAPPTSEPGQRPRGRRGTGQRIEHRGRHGLDPMNRRRDVPQ